MAGAGLAFDKYLRSIARELHAGDSTEHTHRPALKELIESLAEGVTVTNEPKRRTDCGAPDMIVMRGQTPLGYIETKDVGLSLPKVERTAQLRRYLGGLGNLILTDYLEFRWYVAGQRRLIARLATMDAHDRLRRDPEGAKQVAELLAAFLSAEVPTVSGAKELAERMAGLARLIREAIARAFRAEDKGGVLHGQMKAFQRVLLHDLNPRQFADMYAQTICYGLFAARCNMQGPGPFTRQRAAYDIPKTNPFLRSTFGHIAGPDLDDRVAWAVDDLANLLDRANMAAVLEDFGKRTRREDPVVHFYETFLAAYDPSMREMRGVYYTPEPVVSYIVRSVDHILKKDFGLDDGLADTTKVPRYKVTQHGDQGERRVKIGECHKVLILDPACGTGTFLYSVIEHIHEHVLEKGQGGAWSAYVSSHLLPRLFGFELLMAPYAVAHMKLGIQLADKGYDFGSDERLGIYLTNSLEEALELSEAAGFEAFITKEAEAAGKVKQEVPVMVVLGNPPYSGHSANKGKWIRGLLRGIDRDRPTESYFEVDGEPLKERNPKWLNDDYVKFIRFAQWRIKETGYGVLAFVTNHSYLDNPTFRGMRQSLMRTFDDIYLLNLHGNAKKKERCPDGSKDENVFDIQQGVAIGIFVKHGDGTRTGKVRYADLWGLRGAKYEWLWENGVDTTEWQEVAPRSPYYLFVPRDTALEEEYLRGWKITDAMPVNGVGMTTARDHVVIDFEEAPLLERARLFRDSQASDEELCRQLNMPVKEGWDIQRARRLIKQEHDLARHVHPVLYRPFDERRIFYHDSLVWRTVKKIMRHMLTGGNVGMIATRQTRDKWDIFVTGCPITHKAMAAYDINSLFPLYLYAQAEGDNMLFEASGPTEATTIRRPNLSAAFIDDVSQPLGLKFVPEGCGDLKNTIGPEDVFHYMYAVFHSPTYRGRYSEFLKTDFPRLPLTSNAALFRELCALGEDLVSLHLMKRKAPRMTRYPVEGSDVVDKVRYTEPGQGAEEGRVWINKEQYFEGVPPEVWEFHIGGYQVCQKWLKDRKGRRLSFDDIAQYQNIVSALAETISLMAEIDGVIDRHGGWPIR